MSFEVVLMFVVIIKIHILVSTPYLISSACFKVEFEKQLAQNMPEKPRKYQNYSYGLIYFILKLSRQVLNTNYCKAHAARSSEE